MIPRAMVLAAGLGTRLRPLTDNLPKPLVPVANRPLIAYTLALLVRAGVREVGVNLHHLGGAIRQALGDGSAHGIGIVYSPEDPILGTGGGLVRMRSFLRDGTFFVLNSDILTCVDLDAVLGFHRSKRATATMVVRPHPAGSGYTPLIMDEEGWLVGFKRARREPRGATRPVMFCGIHVLEPEVFDFLPPSGFSCVNDQAYARMIEAGRGVAAWVEEGPWYDLGSPALYLEANLALLSRRLRLPQLDPVRDATPDGVLLGRRVRAEDGAVLGPQVAVGDDCAIGPGARVSRSVLWAESTIEAGARLDRVVVAGNIRLDLA